MLAYADVRPSSILTRDAFLDAIVVNSAIGGSTNDAGACNMLVSDEEIARRKSEAPLPIRPSQTPWQELYRATVGQLETGACMELALKYRGVANDPPRHNH